MKLEICKTAREVAKLAAEIVAGQLTEKPDSVLGLPTGSTPIGLYDELADACKQGRLDFSTVRTFNLDEYYPISPSDPQSYRYFMNEHLFHRINIPAESTHVPNGAAEDPQQVCAEYESAIQAAGGVDLQVLGVGRNGHIGFNEPGCPFDSCTHNVTLTENTIAANARFFANADEVPKQALTMGIGTILRAKKIIILITGADKHDALKALLSGKQSLDWPVTALQNHNDVTILCDRAAYDKLYLGIDVGGTETKIGVVSDFGEIVEVQRAKTDCTSKEALLDQIAEISRKFLQTYPICGAGLGLPGIVNSTEGTVGSCGNLPLADTEIKKELERRLGVPFAVENDANCAALAEFTLGAGRGCENMILVTIGTGIGGGIILGKKLYHGKNGGGELGHLITHADGRPCPCGQHGCFEQYASATALRKAATLAVQQNPDSLLAAKAASSDACEAVFAAAEAGCPQAEQVLAGYFRELSHGLKSLLQIFDPDALVLAGGITAQGDHFLQPLKAHFHTSVPLCVATLGNRAGLVGAALLRMLEDDCYVV